MPRTTAIPLLLDRLGAEAERFDAFLVDIWGVVHDGIRPYPGAVAGLEALRRQGRVCLITNAPRRVDSVIRMLRRMGVPDGAYDAIMSSGEATHVALATRPDAFHRALGRRFFSLREARDDDLTRGLDYEEADSLAAADFILNIGANAHDERVESFDALLQEALARDLPMVCANPDLVVMQGELLGICAGAIALRYEEMGGRVAYHGKPYPAIYQRCLELVGAPAPERVLAIGDSLKTDIRGANEQGFASAIIVQGIHAEEFGGRAAPDAAIIARAAKAEGVRPDYALPSLAV